MATIPRLISIALKVCKRRGFPVDSDPEYESAVNMAVWRAAEKYTEGGMPIENLATLYAIRACLEVGRLLKRWARDDAAGAGRGLVGSPTPTPIPINDFEVLSFASAHGKTRAARLLGMRYDSFVDRLYEALHRFRDLHAG